MIFLKYNRHLLLSFVLTGFFLVNFSQIYAASSTGANGFTISPVSNEITVSKGTSQNVEVTVENPADVPIVVKAIVSDFTASPTESGTPNIILNNSTTQLPSNNFEELVTPIPNFTLLPRGEKILNVNITVPKDAQAGGYYGAIRFVPVNSSINGVNVSLVANVATIFLVTVPGNLYEKLSIIQVGGGDLNGNISSFFTNGQLSIVNRIKNSGNIQSQPYGTIIVKNMFGKIVQKLQFNSITPPANILPSSIRKFVDPLSKHNYFGYYTITESFGYGYNDSSNLLIAKSSFVYLPTWAVSSLIIVIIALVAVIYWFIKNRKSNKLGRKLK
jgi:hypothetical protein